MLTKLHLSINNNRRKYCRLTIIKYLSNTKSVKYVRRLTTCSDADNEKLKISRKTSIKYNSIDNMNLNIETSGRRAGSE